MQTKHTQVLLEAQRQALCPSTRRIHKEPRASGKTNTSPNTNTNKNKKLEKGRDGTVSWTEDRAGVSGSGVWLVVGAEKGDTNGSKSGLGRFGGLSQCCLTWPCHTSSGLHRRKYT